MKELYEILQEFRIFEEKLVEIATENDPEKRDKIAHETIALVDEMYKDVETYARGVHIRTREHREPVESDFHKEAMPAAMYNPPKLDKAKVDRFLVQMKGTPVTDALVFLLRESGYFNAEAGE